MYFLITLNLLTLEER